jgi:hypothetical protein
VPPATSTASSNQQRRSLNCRIGLWHPLLMPLRIGGLHLSRRRPGPHPTLPALPRQVLKLQKVKAAEKSK